MLSIDAARKIVPKMVDQAKYDEHVEAVLAHLFLEAMVCEELNQPIDHTYMVRRGQAYYRLLLADEAHNP